MPGFRGYHDYNTYRRVQDIEKMYPREELVIVGENWDLTFTKQQVRQVMERWNEGAAVTEIADELNRLDEEIGILVMELAWKSRVRTREGGVYGRKDYATGTPA